MSSSDVASLRARLDATEALIVRMEAELKMLREQIHASTAELAAQRLSSADWDGTLGRPTHFSES